MPWFNAMFCVLTTTWLCSFGLWAGIGCLVSTLFGAFLLVGLERGLLDATFGGGILGGLVGDVAKGLVGELFVVVGEEVGGSLGGSPSMVDGDVVSMFCEFAWLLQDQTFFFVTREFVVTLCCYFNNVNVVPAKTCSNITVICNLFMVNCPEAWPYGF